MALNQEPLDLDELLIADEYDETDGSEHIYVNGKLKFTASDLAEEKEYQNAKQLE